MQQMTILNKDKTAEIVIRTDITNTLRKIPHGKTVRFLASELTRKQSTVTAIIAKLNDSLGRKEFSSILDDLGNFYITRC